MDDIYGGTTRLFERVRRRSAGLDFSFIDLTDPSALRQALRDDTRMIWVETPSNPLLRVVDLGAVAEVARDRDILVVADNTFATPYLQRPLELGCDIVMHSVTKFLGGQSDILGGVVLAREEARIQELRGLRALLGNILQADEAWILDSRLATVGLRMNRQSKNAQRIAERLAAHPRVERVYYPSLFTDPEQKRIRDAQCDYPGSVFSIDVAGGKRGAFEFLRRLSIARNAVSLGGIESLACHPKTTTHSELSDAELADAGIGDALVRISIGTEHWKDLLADFEAALQ